MAEHRKVAVGGLAFDVDVTGPSGGEPVLLLHGWPERAAMWRGVAERLAERGLRCAAPDQRGYSAGARPQSVDDYQIARLVDDAASIMDALGWSAAHVVGHDWGAAVAWHLAGIAPRRVLSLTALSVPHPRALSAAMASDDDQRSRSAYIKLFRQAPDKAVEALLDNDAAGLVRVFEGSGMDEERVRALVEPIASPEALAATLRWYGAASPADAGTCPVVRVPTTYLWGARDVAIGRVAAEGCGAHVVGDYRFIAMLDAGHWLVEQAPQAVVSAITERVAAS